MTEPFAKKLSHIVRLAPQITSEKPKVLAIIDNQYCGVLELAKAIVKLRHDPLAEEDNIASIPNTEDYLKLSFLFDGNETDHTIAENITLYKGLADEIQSVGLWSNMEPAKQDYKCFPLGGVLRTNRII
jgi:hypothetical protein